ncbi:unnamed protein product [Rhodiola kirilowii]
MSKPWGGIGAWAAEAERAEAEEKEQAAALAAVAPAASFPSLKDSVKKQPKKKKMTLSELYATVGNESGSKRLTPNEMMRLPTGPKERSAEEMQYGGRLGGGFSSYGGGRSDADQEGSWAGNRRSYGAGFDEDRRRGSIQSRVSEFEPSRADGVDNWASGKKSFPAADAGGRPSRYDSLGGGGGGIGGGMSRADEIDNWAAGKKPIPPDRPSMGGFGIRDSGPDSDRWTRGGASFRENNGQERKRLVLEPRRESNVSNAAAKVVNKPSPFGAARPREEVLAEKGLDWKKLDSEIEAKGLSRPTSSQSSRPSSVQSSRSENVSLYGGVEAVVKSKPKVNPFGDAKPREVLLEEKGKDWRKIDMELERRVHRAETEEENMLKEEIISLKKELEKEPKLQDTGPDAPNIQDVIKRKEKELEQLSRELDDKIRFGQKFSERPGSAAGRVAGFSDRPLSRTGSVNDRPLSRGTGDVRPRSGDDRPSFQGGREGGFMGNRDNDRTRTRERW